MPVAPDDMAHLDRPVTRRELRAELSTMTAQLRDELATKAELAAMTAQLRDEFATKTELRSELRSATDELRAEMSTGFAELRSYIEFSVRSVRDELRTHFDLTAESFRSEFRNLFDWTQATTAGLGTRVRALERRVSKLETKRQ